MKPSVYLETSFISYLTAWPSSDLVVAAHQLSSRQWWRDRRQEFRLYVSQPVMDEIQSGDVQASDERRRIVTDLEMLAANEDALTLTASLIKHKVLPEQAMVDALHIAIATVHRVDFLLTWNMKHIGNARVRKSVTRMVEDLGYRATIICTSDELTEPAP
jgi:hypothetical protein